MNNNKLPDTPWHIGYAKKEETDPRRHKARCAHYDNGNCKFVSGKWIQCKWCSKPSYRYFKG